jgi:class 3 adenylate cyclase
VVPETRYAKTRDGLHIAFQVVGDGRMDLLYVPGWQSNVDLIWDDPVYDRFLRRLASFARLIVMDRRGVGCSDRLAPGQLPPLELLMEDITSVLGEVGSERAAVLALFDGGFTSILFAATYPQRVSHLILYDCSPKWGYSEDVERGVSQAEIDRTVEEVATIWDSLDQVRDWISWLVPSRVDDRRFVEWSARLVRQAASPTTGPAMWRLSFEHDVRQVLPLVQAPTLVLHGAEHEFQVMEAGRYLARWIPSARLVELSGKDVGPWGAGAEALADEVQEFLTGTRAGGESNRVLRTVLFTDIVDSTRIVADIGDARWTDLRDAHDRVTRAELERYQGREIDTAGDGFLAVFDGPARAVRCARSIGDAVLALGLVIRAGCHTGELELAGEGVRGIAVSIGARVCAMAGPSEVLVSSTVRDLVAGSGLVFEDRGAHALKGVPGQWNVFAVSGES